MNELLEPTIQGDLPFAEVTNTAGQAETLRLDVYLPAAPGLHPAVLWFHGGGFRPGNDKRQPYIPMLARAFAARGYVGIAPDYRLRQDPTTDTAGTLRDAVSDGRAALEWVRAHAAELSIDPARLAIAGGSAGGMLVLNLVHHATPPTGLKAVINLWATPPAAYRQFGPVNPASPATLIVHGTADALVPYDLSPAFQAELAAAGVPCELLTLEGAPHTPVAHLETIIQTTAAFLQKHLA